MAGSKKGTFWDFCVQIKNKFQYFGDATVLHGFRFVFSLSDVPYLKRIFWLIMIAGCGMGAAGVLREVLKLYSEDAVSYSVDTSYLTWDTPFPAVTVCQQQLDTQRLKGYIQKNKLSPKAAPFLKDVSFWNQKYCKSCEKCNLSTSLNKTSRDCIEQFLPAVQDIRSKCSELLSKCWWTGKQFTCCDQFLPLPTEWGLCYVFNSRLTGGDSVYVVNRVTGLPDLVFTALQQIFIRVHSPDDMISLASENILGQKAVLPLVTEYSVLLKAEQTVNDVSVRSLSPRGRGCLFKHEKPELADLWPHRQYSYSTCILYCRTHAQAQRCNCTHHFMSKLDFLANVTSCKMCSMSCEELQYKVVHISYNRYKNVTPELVARGTRARIGLAQLPALRVRRLAIRDTLGLVVDIGGVGGVFFGASLLSIIEIVYLLCIRKVIQ